MHELRVDVDAEPVVDGMTDVGRQRQRRRDVGARDAGFGFLGTQPPGGTAERSADRWCVRARGRQRREQDNETCPVPEVRW
jgi:hypothetical protein